ncbi:MAG: hypothetical protein ACR2RF_09890 [Geminicoccaceae bacterium]
MRTGPGKLGHFPAPLSALPYRGAAVIRHGQPLALRVKGQPAHGARMVERPGFWDTRMPDVHRPTDRTSQEARLLMRRHAIHPSVAKGSQFLNAAIDRYAQEPPIIPTGDDRIRVC